MSSPCPITGEPRCKCEFEMEPISAPTVKEMLRKLFTDHANYTHLYLLAEILNLPTLKCVTNRLLENQVDIGLAVKPIFGAVKSEALINLLKTHIIDASTVVKAAKKSADSKSDQKAKDALDQAVANLFENSTEVSELIGSVKPKILPFKDVKTHFDQHNHYVIALAGLYIKRKYKAAVTEYDCYYNHMIHFSDLLSLLAM